MRRQFRIDEMQVGATDPARRNGKQHVVAARPAAQASTWVAACRGSGNSSSEQLTRCPALSSRGGLTCIKRDKKPDGDTGTPAIQADSIPFLICIMDSAPHNQ
jgi:hypothetical protein